MNHITIGFIDARMMSSVRRRCAGDIVCNTRLKTLPTSKYVNTTENHKVRMRDDKVDFDRI